MKKIIYTRPDGGLSVVHPTAGARLALKITLPDGDILENLRVLKESEKIKPAIYEDLTEEEIAAGAIPGLLEVAAWSDPVTEPIPTPADFFRRGWPVEGAVAEWAETEDEFVARIAAKGVPADARNVQIVDAAAIPTDRTFRNAWKSGAGCVDHDMPQCVEIQKQRLRELRAPKLAALDVEFMRAIEAGDTEKQVSIAAQKQALRDVTADPALLAAKTLDALKAVVPVVLR